MNKSNVFLQRSLELTIIITNVIISSNPIRFICLLDNNVDYSVFDSDEFFR